MRRIGLSGVVLSVRAGRRVLERRSDGLLAFRGTVGDAILAVRDPPAGWTRSRRSRSAASRSGSPKGSAASGW